MERVTINIDMDCIIYGRIKKVEQSTTDLRFRVPEEATKCLGLKPEDDYVAFPTEDKSKILLVRIGSVVTAITSCRISIYWGYRVRQPKFSLGTLLKKEKFDLSIGTSDTEPTY